MNKISAIVIAKNEENVIIDCLDSIAFCDETIVIDGGSQDRTREIVEKKNAKVFVFESNDFSASRNLGLKMASHEWILYVDADERVDELLKENIKEKINNRENMSAYKIRRKNFYLGNHEWPHIEKLERLFRKDDLKEWKGVLHESPVVNGKIGEINGGFMNHFTHRDISYMLNKTIEWSKYEAKLRFESGHPKMTWWRFIRVMVTAFFDSYIRQGGWRVGTVGVIESIYQSFSMFITYARLWEMQQKKK